MKMHSIRCAAAGPLRAPDRLGRPLEDVGHGAAGDDVVGDEGPDRLAAQLHGRHGVLGEEADAQREGELPGLEARGARRGGEDLVAFRAFLSAVREREDRRAEERDFAKLHPYFWTMRER